MRDKQTRSTIVKNETADRKFVVVDVTDKVVGRAAAAIANVLRGKHRANFTPHADGGDFVIVTNAAKVKFSGNKWDDKNYYHHTGYMGGIKEISAKDLLKKHPEDILKIAVWGMLPKNTLSRKLMKKLWIYPGNEHPHSAQNPTAINIEKII